MKSRSVGRRPRRSRMRGQSMVEYLLLATIAVLLIAVPYQDQPSVVAYVIDFVKTLYANFLAAISLPQ